jgi:hypothetical protein
MARMIVNCELGRKYKKKVVTIFKELYNICLDKLKKIRKISLRLVIFRMGDSKQTLHEYEAEC